MYRFADHTGEIEIELEAASEPELFAEGLAAMRELLEDAPEGERLRRAVAVEARDRATLLADWLGELAFLAETEGLVPERVAELELEDRALRAVVEGRRGSPAHLVKAATYHRLALERTGDRLRARVVLDV
ncbi:MAG TPA: archease [Thermoleophilaceae bacterium]|nr:archease [Thermoleophilaceae bacterium]